MTEWPIRFSGPMVRAILAGTKTQKRWPVKCRYNITAMSTNAEFRAMSRYPLAKDTGSRYHYVLTSSGAIIGIQCPHGQRGDMLWVRETFNSTHSTEEHTRKYGQTHYRADLDAFSEGMLALKWRPSIHMPRWASRITLEVTGVRVERLQEISEEDAKAEGVTPSVAGQDAYGPVKTHRTGFVRLWESINGKKSGCSWQDNPWVWVVEFKVSGDCAG